MPRAAWLDVLGVRRVRVEEVLDEVAAEYAVEPEAILSQSRSREVARARRAFCRRAYEQTGATMAELARLTGRSQPAVWQMVRGGTGRSGGKNL